MSGIDKAFAKAYSQRSRAETRSHTAAVAAPPQSLPDLTVHPHAEKSATVWIDPIADQYLRRDPAQRPGTRPAQPTSTRQVSNDGPRQGHTPVAHQPRHTPATSVARPTIGGAETKVRGDKMVDPKIGSSPAVAHTAAAPVQAETAIEFRTDKAAPAVGHPFGLPIGKSAASPSGFQTASTHSSKNESGFAAWDDERPAAGQKPFAAVWEVDSFEFPAAIVSLFGEPTLMKSIGFPLDRAVCEGLQTLLVTSEGPGAGRTTVATGIAISAAMAGLRVALVDAATPKNIESVSLADTLNFDIRNGWLDAIRGGISVSEIAIHSIEDQFTVFPLLSSARSSDPTPEEFRRLVRALRQGFDLVVIDGPAFLESSRILFPAERFPADATRSAEPIIDAAIVVQDVRLANTEATVRVMQSLKRCGTTGLGVVENFV
jgi:Mrp family chromosome partitioning ATPase